MKSNPAHGLLLPSFLLLLLLLLPLAGMSFRSQLSCLASLSAAPSSTPPASFDPAVVASCFPWRIDLWENAAHEALQAGEPETAARLLERARQEALDFGFPFEVTLSAQGLLDLAAASYQTGDYAAALETWQTISSQTGFSNETGEMLARLHLAQADYPAASAAWQAVLDQNPRDAQAQFQLGLLLAAQDPEAALPHLDQAAELDPQLEGQVSILRRGIMGARIGEDPAYSLLSSGRALASLDRWHLAAEAFRQAVLKRPYYADAWAYLGEARQHLGEASDPVESSSNENSDGLVELQTALELDPRSLAAQLFLSLYWQRKGDTGRALDSIHRAMEIDPENPVLTAQLASIQAEAGDFQAAYETYRRSAELSPFDPSYPRQMISFAIQYNYQVEQIALPAARRLLAENPQNPVDLDLMGQVLTYLGDLSSAQKFLSRALQIDPFSAPAHLHLGLVYLLQGETQAAQDHLETAQALDPLGPSAEQARRLLEESIP